MAMPPPRVSRNDFIRFAARVSTPSSLIVQYRNESVSFSTSSGERSSSPRCLWRSFAEAMSMGCAFVSDELQENGAPRPGY